MNKIAGRVFSLVCGLVPLIFAGVFLASTVSLYRTVTADRRTESELKTIVSKLPKTSRRAGNINAILTAEDMKLRKWNEDKKSWKSLDSFRGAHFATHGYEPVEKLSYKLPGSARVTHLSTHGAPFEKLNYESSKSWYKASAARRLQFSNLEAKDVHQRAVSISSSFDALLSSLAELFTTIKFTEDDVRFAHAHYAFSVSLEREDPYQKYVYSLLALEKGQQKQQIKPINYYESRKQLAKAYLQVATVGEPTQERISTADLQNARTRDESIETGGWFPEGSTRSSPEVKSRALDSDSHCHNFTPNRPFNPPNHLANRTKTGS